LARAAPCDVSARHAGSAAEKTLEYQHFVGRAPVEANHVVNRPLRLHPSRSAKQRKNSDRMEILRHPLYSILAVILIGALCGALAHRLGKPASGARALAVMILAGIGAAFFGFHLAMLSNQFTGVILFPFAVSLVVSAVASFALRGSAR
jgi:uncharacterized membrane protein YeaQ/YmgE (transglycosylase-associated protein family)